MGDRSVWEETESTEMMSQRTSPKRRKKIESTFIESTERLSHLEDDRHFVFRDGPLGRGYYRKFQVFVRGNDGTYVIEVYPDTTVEQLKHLVRDRSYECEKKAPIGCWCSSELHYNCQDMKDDYCLYKYDVHKEATITICTYGRPLCAKCEAAEEANKVAAAEGTNKVAAVEQPQERRKPPTQAKTSSIEPEEVSKVAAEGICYSDGEWDLMEEDEGDGSFYTDRNDYLEVQDGDWLFWETERAYEASQRPFICCEEIAQQSPRRWY